MGHTGLGGSAALKRAAADAIAHVTGKEPCVPPESESRLAVAASAHYPDSYELVHV